MIHELVVARDERVHGGGSRSRDPRASDAVRGDRRGGARLARQDDSRVGCAELLVCDLGTMAVRGGARRSSAPWRGADQRRARRGPAAPRRASSGRHAGPLVEGAASARLARAPRESRRRAVRGRAWRRRHLPRTRPARRLSDRRPEAAQAGSPLVPAAGGGGADPLRSRRSVSRASAAQDSPACGPREGSSRRSACTRGTGSPGTASPSTSRRIFATSI